MHRRLKDLYVIRRKVNESYGRYECVREVAHVDVVHVASLGHSCR